MSSPRIVVFDIETSHNIVAVFDLRNNEAIPHENLLQERSIICAAWKELGGKVESVATYDGDDQKVCAALHTMMSQADVLVAHYGDRFDMPFVQTRMLKHGLPPLPPIRPVDTWKVAKRYFKFNSNRLDYLGQFLGLGRKKSTPRGLWLKVLGGDRKAVDTMLAYNKQDVVLLENVFKKLRPYVKNLNYPQGCPKCGGHKLQRRGQQVSVAQTYMRFQCQKCGGWSRASKGQPTPAVWRAL